MNELTHLGGPQDPKPTQAHTHARVLRAMVLGLSLGLPLGLGLSGCGGGVVVGLDLGYADVVIGAQDAPPAVSLAASSSTVRAGEVLRLVAAATDDWAVESVSFYQADAYGRSERLRTLYGPPWTLDVLAAPVSGNVAYFWARAADGQGQTGDSEWVRVNVLP